MWQGTSLGAPGWAALGGQEQAALLGQGGGIHRRAGGGAGHLVRDYLSQTPSPHFSDSMLHPNVSSPDQGFPSTKVPAFSYFQHHLRLNMSKKAWRPNSQHALCFCDQTLCPKLQLVRRSKQAAQWAFAIRKKYHPRGLCQNSAPFLGAQAAFCDEMHCFAISLLMGSSQL
jgi:hypothetical protein